ncbi:MAG: DNA polymerase domain-containing protein, partial [Candidatus Baldrarchaeia archaeon]
KNVTIQNAGENNKVSVPGRVVVDVRALVKADFHLKRYTLEHVAEKLINEGKLDVDYKDIPKLWAGKSGDINKLIDYARKDAVLPLKILLEKRLLDKYFELSKVSGLLLQDVISGGQSSRVEGLLLRYGKKRNLIIPCKPSQEEIKKRSAKREKLGLKGAIVLDPKVGLYHGNNMILVLDFRSLYPSLIMAYNICFTTLLKNCEEVEKYIEAPTGARFVTKDVKEGLLPEILKDLMNFRVAVKKAMKAEEDPEKKRQLDAKQLALKIMMNSFYGYTGYLRARVYSLDVANAITALGRYTIEFTRKIIEEKYGLETVYGDTDSVLIKINTSSLEEAAEIGEKISKEISKSLPQPMLLEFEKIYKSFLLLSKKRYAGWMFEKTQNGKWKDKIDTKGIETVRREWCDLVGEVVEKVINMLLKQPDVNLVVNYVRDVLQKLKQGKIPIEKLIMTRTLSKSPKAYKAKQPHAYLALKIAKRSPGSAPTIGERIPFVIVKGKGLIAERAEDPKYVQENNLEIDANYYIEKQLLPPIERILKPLGITRQELLTMGKQRELTKFVGFEEKVEVKPVESASTSKAILEEVVCPHCKNTLSFKDAEKRFCPHCFSEIDPKQLLENALDVEIYELFSTFLTQPLVCMNCKSSFRRPPLSGKCPKCGSDNLVVQIDSPSFKEKIKTFEHVINEEGLALPKRSLEILKTYSIIP